VTAADTLELDHVLLAAHDLDEASDALETRHGLTAVGGGRHPGWGTANRIVPLGDAYLELVAAADEADAACTAFGRWVLARRASPFALLGWAVRTPNLDGQAARLGLTASEGARERPDGSMLRWRLAGVDDAVAEPCRPFFIEWAPDSAFPGRDAAGSVRLERLELSGDGQRLAAWLGGFRLPVSVRPGEPSVTAVVLRGDSGELALRQG
jgi:Glyoxalase-like domain